MLCFFQISLALVFLYLELGPAIFAGVAALLLIIPVNVFGGYFVKKWETTKLKAKGKTPALKHLVIHLHALIAYI